MRRSLLPISLALALAVTGCAAGDPSAEPDAAAEGDHSAPAEGEAAAGEHGAAAEPAAMPEDFPTDEVPLVERELHAASVSGGVWTIAFTSDDTTADLAEATALLTGVGFENTLADPLYGDFADAHHKVRVYVIPDNHTITYLVTPTALPAEEAPAEEEEESSH